MKQSLKFEVWSLKSRKAMCISALAGMLLWGCSPVRDASGYFELSEVVVTAEVGGQLLSLDVKPGSKPAAGQSVGLIDSTTFYLRKMQLLAVIHSGGTAEELAFCDSALQATEQLLQKCRIINPLDGIVMNCYTAAGATVAPSQPLYRIADRHNLLLRVYLPAETAATLKTGQQVTVFPQTKDEAEISLPGTIVWIATQAVTPLPTDDNKTPQPVHCVKIAVDNTAGIIKAGSVGEVETGL